MKRDLTAAFSAHGDMTAQHTSDIHCTYDGPKKFTASSSASPLAMAQPAFVPTELHPPPLPLPPLRPPMPSAACMPKSSASERRQLSCGVQMVSCGVHHFQGEGMGTASKIWASGHVEERWSLRHIDVQCIRFDKRRGDEVREKGKICDDWKRKKRITSHTPDGRLWGKKHTRGVHHQAPGRP